MSLIAAHKSWNDAVEALNASLVEHCTHIGELSAHSKDDAPYLYDFKEWIDSLIHNSKNGNWFLYRINGHNTETIARLRVEMTALKSAWAGKINVNVYNDDRDLCITFKAI